MCYLFYIKKEKLFNWSGMWVVVYHCNFIFFVILM